MVGLWFASAVRIDSSSTRRDQDSPPSPGSLATTSRQER